MVSAQSSFQESVLAKASQEVRLEPFEVASELDESRREVPVGAGMSPKGHPGWEYGPETRSRTPRRAPG